MSKKRAFVRYSKQGKIVPGSLILTSGSYPSGPSTWNEVPADLCCDLITLTYDMPDTSINLVTLRLFCNGVRIHYLYTEQNSTNITNVINILNNTFNVLGTFSNPSGNIIELVMNASIKTALCPTGTLTFDVVAD
jgi:hypothetical protein